MQGAVRRNDDADDGGGVPEPAEAEAQKRQKEGL
jgi:hypothetical protein